MIELDRERIIKGLEHCDGGCCGDCPYLLADCKKELPKKALALINSQEQRIGELEAENERLKARVFAENHLRHQVEEMLANEMNTVKADTIDEFVKMVKEKMREVATGKRTSLIGTGWIDEIARELKGE